MISLKYIFNNSNFNKWKQLVKSSETPTEYKTFIKLFLQPDNISFVLFSNHIRFISLSTNFSMNKEAIEKLIDESIDLSPTFEKYYSKNFAMKKPMGIPDYFVAAYPDVCKWGADNEDILTSLLEGSEDILFDKNDNASPELLRILINVYKKNHKLECDNSYL